MTKEMLAETLNGRQYRDEITQEEENLAKEHNLVVVFGASDDLMEFRGAIEEEMGSYGGGKAYVVQKKKKKWTVIDDSDYDDIKEKLEEFDISFSAHTVESVWDDQGYSWTFKTLIPHATFEILEDGDKYCRGIVFSLNDL